MKKKNRVICSIIAGTAAGTAALCHVLNKREKREFAGENCSAESRKARMTFYEKYGKRILDITVCSLGLIVLSPVIAVSSLVVFLEDPGPVIFKQKRVGIHKSYFYIHKLRSMKQNCPDIPTHLMENPDQYLLKSGKAFRKYSIDELPQLIDILRGKMSLVGPRPALWNQDDLVAEREKYGANDVMSGLTGWAQINGRDELEIPDKAKLDGEYAKALKKSSISGFLMDCRCLLGTVTSVLHHDGVVEGGTGELHREEEQQKENSGSSHKESSGVNSVFGFGKSVTVNHSTRKKVLITGAGSYIGESFEIYAKRHYGENFEIDTIDMQDSGWREKDFSGYDIVYHVAGIAHADVGNVSEETKKKYYAVNTDLAIETAEKAKAAGVKLFVFMSSMIVYGESAPVGKTKMVTAEMKPEPANFYGDSKWQADKGVRTLSDDTFHVAVLRPPMIYGRGSKGNYPTLAKMAKKLPVFPEVKNQRSMLYIENLCEFLCQMMLVDIDCYSGKGNVFFPQNGAYTKTSEMVGMIAETAGHRICVSRVLAPLVLAAGKVPGKIGGLVNKAFGNSCYEQKMSVYAGIDYQKVSLWESVRRTEGTKRKGMQNPKVLILASVASMIDQFNMSNINILLGLGYHVDVACNFEIGNTCSKERVEELKKELAKLEVECYQIDFTRSVKNLIQERKAYKQVKELVNLNGYIFIHCHSPIGGVVGRIVGHEIKTKVIYTAHGFHFYHGAPKINWLIYYPIEKVLSRWTDVLITINREDYRRAEKDFSAKRTVYIPGIGVDLEKFSKSLSKEERNRKRKQLGIPPEGYVVLSVGELNHNKNHSSVIRAIASLENKSHIYYIIAGKGNLKEQLEQEAKNSEVNLILLGYRDDVYDLYHLADVYIHPSFREGMSVAVMEARASGTLVIASRIRGNVDFIPDEYLFDPTDIKSIADLLVRAKKHELMYYNGNNKNIMDYSNVEVGKIMKQVYEQM